MSGYASAETEEFEEYTEDSHFIASRGAFIDTVDQEWKKTIVDCWASLPDSFSYYKFDKAIHSFSCNNEFIIVDLSSEHKGEINDSRIDHLYKKIEVHCEESTGFNEVPVVFMWAEDEEDLIYEYDPDAFQKAKNSSRYVAARGIVPLFTDEDEWLEWSEKVHEARYIFDLEPYFLSQGGPLLSYGFKKYSGYVEVGVNKETPNIVNDSSLSEVYQIIDEHFEDAGISNIPVVFVWDMPVQLDEALAEEPVPIEYDSESETAQNDDASTQSTLGFTSIMIILCILILIRIRR
ncbi:hypothetical protein V7O62_09135 [Methanolobus sp. ZRKC2]|uniref:hypothetical protein n=1 Tax=Methanolobus sp. ZRKC2 TaxID=3125783 RepID=UPI00324F4FDD